MGDRIGRWLLRWRWAAMLIVGLVVTITELIEHEPLVWPGVDRDLVQEVIGLGILTPLIVGCCLTAVARIRSEKTMIHITTRESERKRLARDLHDTLGQNLAYVRLQLERLGNLTATGDIEQVQSEIRQLYEVIESTCEQMRDKLAELQPPASLDLAGALADYAHVVGQRAHFAVDFHYRGEPRPLPQNTHNEVFYFFREALVNIEKHARASRVTIDMTWLDDGLRISLADDGKGFDLAESAPRGHLGLQIMNERAREINGRLTLRSTPFSGTELALWLPFDAG